MRVCNMFRIYQRLNKVHHVISHMSQTWMDKDKTMFKRMGTGDLDSIV